MNEKNIIEIIHSDGWMMRLLVAVRTLNLPDWYIGAGFVRGKVWDTLHNYSKRTPTGDIDVIYFDRSDFADNEAAKESTKRETEYEKRLDKLVPGVNWSVTNQARMHLYHHDRPYSSSEDALGEWVETATCIGVTLDENDHLRLATPRGISDLVNLILKPTHSHENELFFQRIKDKKWLEKWPKLKVAIFP